MRGGHVSPDEWLVDNGATHHMTKAKDDLAERSDRTISHVRLGDGKRIKCVDEGTVRIPNRTVGRDRGTLVLESTLVVPELERNLISVYGLMRSGYDVNFRSKDMSCRITRGRTKIVAVLEGNLWIVRSNTMNGLMEGIADVAAASHFTRGAKSLEVWHRRFNHANVASLRRMASEKKVYGLDLIGAPTNFPPCVGCSYGKHARDPFPGKQGKRTEKKLELVHSDLCGPMEVHSIQSRKRYILTFIDDYTRRTWVYLLATKDETFETFRAFQARVER